MIFSSNRHQYAASHSRMIVSPNGHVRYEHGASPPEARYYRGYRTLGSRDTCRRSEESSKAKKIGILEWTVWAFPLTINACSIGHWLA